MTITASVAFRGVTYPLGARVRVVPRGKESVHTGTITSFTEMDREARFALVTPDDSPRARLCAADELTVL